MNTPVTVVGGYLGAGKTTLINRVLADADERLAVLVNDFGDIDIDSALLADLAGDTISLANGCICCSLADGFVSALDTVRTLDPPADRVVIEASGVADPATVGAYAHAPGFRLDAVVTVVDAESVRTRANDRYVGDTVVRQIRSADLLALTRTDLLSDDEVAGVRAWLGSLSPAPAIDAPLGQVPAAVLFDRPHRVDRDSPPKADHEADVLFTSWSVEVDGPMDIDIVHRVVESLPAAVVRVKGIVRPEHDPGSRVAIHRVGVRVTVADDGTWTTGPSRLVAIGLREDPSCPDDPFSELRAVP